MIADVLVLILAILGGLVALVLIMPLSARAQATVDGEDGAAWRARIAWAFGLVTLHLDKHGAVIRLFGLRVARSRWGSDDPAARERAAARKAKKVAKKEAKKEAKRTKDPGGGSRGFFWFLARRRGLVSMLGRYVRALHIRGRVEGVVGLAQPDQTAVVHQLLLVVERAAPDGVVAVDIDWVEEVFELEGWVGAWVCLLEPVVITLWFFFHPKWRRVWRAPPPAAAASQTINGGVM